MKLRTRDTESADFRHVKVTKERDFDQRREETNKHKRRSSPHSGTRRNTFDEAKKNDEGL